MPESKIVYVNEDYDSDQDNAIIYGGAPAPAAPEPAPESPPKFAPEGEEADADADADADAEEASADAEEEPADAEEEPADAKKEPADAEKVPTADEALVTEPAAEPAAERDDELAAEGDDKSASGSIFGGDDGYKSDDGDSSSISSLDTDAILNVDPLYFRLTKFLQTGGSEPENVAEILQKINTNLELMNQNLMNLMNAKSTQ